MNNFVEMNIYKKCPIFENEKYLLRLVEKEDASELLSVYSDEKSVPLFNSDNCNGDDFHYTTIMGGGVEKFTARCYYKKADFSANLYLGGYLFA